MIKHYTFNAIKMQYGYPINVKVLYFASDLEHANKKMAEICPGDPADFSVCAIADNLPQIGDQAWWDDSTGMMIKGMYKVIGFEDPDRVILERIYGPYAAYVGDVKCCPYSGSMLTQK